jgi:hypothetical protein
MGHHGGHHGSIQGTNVDPNWTGTTVRSQDGDWRWRWFDRLSPAQIGGLFFLGFILWLFVVYNTSHPPGSGSKLADLKNFPSNKYEYSIRAASGQQAWEREPTKPIEHAIPALPHGSARLFTNTQPLAPQPTAAQSMAGRGVSARFMTAQHLPQAAPISRPRIAVAPVVVAPAEDLLSADENSAPRPFNAAFGKARQDILPQESAYAAPQFNLSQKVLLSSRSPASETDVSADRARNDDQSTGTDGAETSTKSREPLMVNLVASQPRVDLSGSLGEIAEGRSGNAGIPSATRIAAIKAVALSTGTAAGTHIAAGTGREASAAKRPSAPRAAAVQGGGSIFHSVTQATPDGVMRTRLVVNR